MDDHTVGEGIIEDLQEVLDILNRGERLEVHLRVDVVERPQEAR